MSEDYCRSCTKVLRTLWFVVGPEVFNGAEWVARGASSLVMLCLFATWHATSSEIGLTLLHNYILFWAIAANTARLDIQSQTVSSHNICTKLKFFGLVHHAYTYIIFSGVLFFFARQTLQSLAPPPQPSPQKCKMFKCGMLDVAHTVQIWNGNFVTHEIL